MKPGEYIGPYQVESVLGDGGMGTVYKVTDIRFDRAVAVKVLHPQLSRDPRIAERFRIEAVIQAKLDHPGIVTVFDFISEQDVPAIVMEFVDGQSLGAMIEEIRAPLPLGFVLSVMEQVLFAMSYAHEKGLIHRDLKPSNVLMRSLRGKTLAKVTDFGIAKVLGSDKLMTATGAKMGTLAYMSPEQIRNPKAVDQRSDIYSLGVMLYQMLTGDVPFRAPSEFELMQQIVEMPPTIGLLAGHVPEAMLAALHKSLAKDPKFRFGSCDEFHSALHAVKSEGNPKPKELPGASIKNNSLSDAGAMNKKGVDEFEGLVFSGPDSPNWAQVSGAKRAAIRAIQGGSEILSVGLMDALNEPSDEIGDDPDVTRVWILSGVVLAVLVIMVIVALS